MRQTLDGPAHRPFRPNGAERVKWTNEGRDKHSSFWLDVPVRLERKVGCDLANLNDSYSSIHAQKQTELNASPLHPEMHEHMSTPINEWTRERIAIGLLAPDIQRALLTGKAPLGLDPEKLLSRDMPLDWEGQRKFLGIRHAE